MKAERLAEEIKSRLDIVDVLSDYVELRRSGQNFKGLCPFHAEKTPSFMVNPDKQIFHCFGCGIGGNCISFVMKYENLSFQEALRFLGKRAGIDLKEFSSGNRQDEGTRERLITVMREASRVFGENLRRSKTASAYLLERGVTDEMIRLFSLGYAERDWHLLSRALREKGFSDALLLQSGTVSAGEKGIYDTFRDRIMFPISDLQGDIIAFGGRVMSDGQPKYLNSPDTPLFRKGETLYGLNLAKDGIRKRGYALVVEGYFDVIVCHQFGFTNVVAPLGTALTTGHLHKLKRFTKRTVLVFDGDEAGKSAAKRSIPLLLEQGFVPKILLLPEKDDPDSFLRRDGIQPFSKLLGRSQSAVDFILSSSQKDKTETVHEILESISVATDSIMKEELVRELSEKTGIRESVIREEMEALGKKHRERTKGQHAGTPQKGGTFCYDEEILLLSAVLAFPDRLETIVRAVAPDEFTQTTVRDIFLKFSQGAGKHGIHSMLSDLTEEEKNLVTRLTVHPGFDCERVDKNIEDCIRRIGARKIDTRLKQLHERIKHAEDAGEQELLESLLPERQRLMKEVR